MKLDWKRPARNALIWAGVGIVLLITGLLLDRYTGIQPLYVWILLLSGMAGLVVGAIILLNAVAPRRKNTK